MLRWGQIFSLLIFLLLLNSCTSFLISFFGYRQSEIRDYCKTPEPGTWVSVRCRLITELGRDYYSIDSPQVEIPRQNLLKRFKPSIRSTSDFKIISGCDSIGIRLYNNSRREKRSGQPVIVYYHGGGFVKGSIQTFDGYCRKLAKESGALVISVDYRLAPEYPFPAAICDCYSALLWAETNCKTFGGDPERIIVMGGSAGGNLAAVIPIVARDSCGPAISGQIICYPVTPSSKKRSRSVWAFAPSATIIFTSRRATGFSRSWMRGPSRSWTSSRPLRGRPTAT